MLRLLCRGARRLGQARERAFARSRPTVPIWKEAGSAPSDAHFFIAFGPLDGEPRSGPMAN